MNLNRKQLSFLITFFSMSIIVMLAYNIHLGGQQEEEYVIEMALSEEILEELFEEEKKLEELASNADHIKSHMAFNQTAKPSVGNPEPLKTLQELQAERALNEGTGELLSSDTGYAASLKELAKQREKNKKQLGEKEAQKKEFTNNLAEKRTSISYSLVDRNAYDLPPPIYTCIEGGKVVINVSVDADGYVTDTSFNDKSSTTSNGCLVDNALKYAAKAYFNSSSKKTQKGTITYLFQRK